MIQAAGFALHFLMSMGLIIFALALGKGIYHRHSHTPFAKDFLAGLVFGAFALLCELSPFYYEEAAIFGYGFVLLAAAALSYRFSALLPVFPFYIAGTLLTHGREEPVKVLIVSILVCIYCAAINLFGFSKRRHKGLLALGTVPIAFSLPLATASLSYYDARLILMFFTFAALATAAFFAAVGRKLSRASAFMMYVKELLEPYGRLYSFAITKDKKEVRLCRRFADNFELDLRGGGFIKYEDFLSSFAGALSGDGRGASEEETLLCKKLEKYIYVSPKTGKSRCIELVCHKGLLGGYRGLARDITDSVGKEDALYTSMQRDPATGFKPYYMLKSDMAKLAAQSPGLMLQIHVMITFARMADSFYGYELEREYFSLLGRGLGREFLGAHIYSMKSGEFHMLVFGIETDERARAYAERVSDFLSKPPEPGRRVGAAATCGVLISETSVCVTAEDAGRLANKAIFAKDMALQKNSGVCYYHEDEHKSYIERHRRGERLPVIIREGKLTTVFQPIVRAVDGGVFAYEALTRIPDGYAPIEQIINDSLLLSLDTELDTAMIRSVCRVLRQTPFHGNLFINKLSRTPIIPEFGELSCKLAQRGNLLYVEFTEYSEHKLSDFAATAEELCAKNIRIAIDDYGNGYSSQSFLSSINPAIIKIDRELISEIDSNRRKQTLVRGIVEYCSSMNIECVAEGVSTKAEMLKAIELGVDYLQGFYLGMPEQRPAGIPADVRLEIIEASKIKKQAV